MSLENLKIGLQYGSMEKMVYLVSPVRNVTQEQADSIQAYAEELTTEGNRLFNPVKDAPQEDKTGYNIVMSELRFMAEAAQNKGRIDILWNAGGTPSEGSRVDLGAALALGLNFKLVEVFNKEEMTGADLGYQIILDIESSSNSALMRLIYEELEIIRASKTITIDWHTEMKTQADEWERVYLGMVMGCIMQNPEIKLKLGNLSGTDPLDKKSYVKVIKEIEKFGFRK